MAETTNVEQVELKKILPDENQPRKYFAADKMFNLKQSIKRHGIKVPITVEDMGNGKYLLIDGERRFRAALEIGLKSIPCIIEAPKSESERLIEQFNIQEQHESWTPVEKAMAIVALSKVVEKTLHEVCKMLDIPSSIAARYIAFAELADKESFVKNEVPLDYVMNFKYLKNAVKIIKEKALEEDFTRSDEKKMEHQITKMIVRGDLLKRSDMTKLGDSFRKNPKLIDKFMENDSVTPTSLFLEAKAQGAHNLRNAVNQARSMGSHIEAYLKIRDVKPDAQQIDVLARGATSLKKLLDFLE